MSKPTVAKPLSVEDALKNFFKVILITGQSMKRKNTFH